jgi:predicted O-methyltransferase YrrM
VQAMWGGSHSCSRRDVVAFPESKVGERMVHQTEYPSEGELKPGPGEDWGDARSEGRFTAPRRECPEPHLWRSEDKGAAEDEVHDLLRQLIRTLKPRTCLETGAWHGRSAVSLASALSEEGRGFLWSLESDPAAALVASQTIADAGLSEWCEVVEESSLKWCPPAGSSLDFVFLDSWSPIRSHEFLRLRQWMHRRTLVAVHDTADTRRQPRRQFQVLHALGIADVIWLPTPRGLAFAQPARSGKHVFRSKAAWVVLDGLMPMLHRLENRWASRRRGSRARRH